LESHTQRERTLTLEEHTRKREDSTRDLGDILRHWFQNFIIMAPAELRKDFIASLLKYRVCVCLHKEYLFHVFIFMEVIAVYCEDHTEHTNTLCGQNAVYIKSVRTSQETHYVSATKPGRLMLFREIIAVYCENCTKHVNTLCGQNAVYIKSVRTSQETH
jgi:hypothetical protein